MKLERGRPEVCSADDPQRPALEAVYLRDGALEATDSYCIVRVPVMVEEGDLDGPINRLALELARKHTQGKLDCSRENHTVIPGVGGINRPKLEREAPTYEKLAAENRYDPTLKITLDPRLLLGVAEAMGTRYVTIDIPPHEKHAIRITSDSGGEALLMPVQRGNEGRAEP